MKELLTALDYSPSRFADEFDLPRQRISEMLSDHSRYKDLPQEVITRLIIEKNLNAHWWHTGQGPIFKPFEETKTEAIKSLALIGKINRKPNAKKLIDLILSIPEDEYDHLEKILKTFR